MPAPECLVFPDGDDWIVFAPRSRLLMRTNRQAAERFRGLPDQGEGPPAEAASEPGYAFEPTHVSIACTNRCGQRCLYCYGTPVHDNRARLDPAFCTAGLRLAAEHAARLGHPLQAHFHGVGEPTHDWPLFAECVELAERVSAEHGIRRRIHLCTGGQVGARQAVWIAEHLDEVQISIDGPADIHNRQRPLAQGGDSLRRPLRLAREALTNGRRVVVKATVSELSVGRMPEIVAFVAAEIGPVALDFGLLFALPWSGEGAPRAPDWRDFVQGFRAALAQGERTGVRVGHPSIKLQSLLAPPGQPQGHFGLAPPDLVTAFYDVPREGASNPELGVYGRFDAATGRIHFDAHKRRQLQSHGIPPECRRCACLSACFGPSGVKGRMPSFPADGETCQARRGVLQELLRRAAPPRPTTPATEPRHAQPGR